jgi:hypothetical protein
MRRSGGNVSPQHILYDSVLLHVGRAKDLLLLNNLVAKFP